jgi:hypothetical protein
VPGVPGAADLEAALRRLTPAEVLARRATLSSGLTYTGYDYPDGPQTPPSYLPYGCRTPDSIMSTGSSGLSGFSGHTTGSWKLPEKLQVCYHVHFLVHLKQKEYLCLIHQHLCFCSNPDVSNCFLLYIIYSLNWRYDSSIIPPEDVLCMLLV